MKMPTSGSLCGFAGIRFALLATFSAAAILLPAAEALAVSVTLSGVPSSQITAGTPINVAATVSQSPSRVEFYLDGKLARTESGSPYCLGGDSNAVCNSYSTSGLASGSHSLQAKAFVGSSTYSSSTASFTIASSASTPPTTSVILSGVPSSQITPGTPINIAATVSQPPSRVEFYLDGKLARTESESPYCLGGNTGDVCNSYSTSGLASGSHSLQAKAFVGSSTYSSSMASFTITSTVSTTSSSLYPIPFSSQYVGPSRTVTMSVDQVLSAIGAPGQSGATWSVDTWSSSGAASDFSRSMISWYLANGIQPTINSADTRKVQQYSGVTYGSSLSPRDGIDKDAADNKLLPKETEWPHLRVPTSAFKNGNPMPYPYFPVVASGKGGFWYHVGSESQPIREVWNSPLCYGDGNEQFSTVYDANSSVSGTQPILSIRFTIPTDYQPVFRNDGDNPGIVAGRQADGRGAMTELYHASEGTGTYGGDLGSCYNQGTNVYPYKLEGGSNAAAKEKYAAKLITPLDASRVASGAIKYFDHPIGFAAWKIYQAVVPASQNRDSGMGSKVITDWGWLMYGSRVRLMLSDTEVDALTSNLMVRAVLKTFNRYGGVMMDGSGYNGQHVSMRTAVTDSDLTPFGGESVVNTELDRLFDISQVKENWALVIPPMWSTKLP